MSRLFLDRLTKSSIGELEGRRSVIQLDPEYQRSGGIWTDARRRLLIDTIINNYDIPKIYLRHFVPSVEVMGRRVEFAVIDGRQRLEAIWGYLDGKYTLDPEEFEFIEDPQASRAIASLTFDDLWEAYPEVARQIRDYRLDVVTVETDSEDLIEDMFLRLNESAPLNAAEKRNAFGGPLPRASKALAAHPFFTTILPYENRRYRYLDVGAKFLFFEHNDGLADTKKLYLDRFFKDAAAAEDPAAESVRVDRLVSESRFVLDDMARVFSPADPLLRTVGMASVYYLLFRERRHSGAAAPLSRREFVDFETLREQNRERARHDETDGIYDLLEFDRLAQSPNDKAALTFRLNILRDFLDGRAVE